MTVTPVVAWWWLPWTPVWMRPIRIWAVGDSGQCAVTAQGCIDAGDVRDASLYCPPGIEGIVVDGAVRDIGAIRQVGLPVFCRGVHGAGISRALMSVDVDQPVRIGYKAPVAVALIVLKGA